MNTELIKAELTMLAQQAGATPTRVREVARERLGSNLEYPLIVYACGGVAMRICVPNSPTIWVAVPPEWLDQKL